MSLLIPTVEFSSERLFLRRPVVDDANPLFEGYCQDVAVTRFLMWTPHESVQVTRKFLMHCIEQWEKGREYTWTISLQIDRLPIGMISARRDDHRIELGYVLSRQHWNKGIMVEAARMVSEWWFSQAEIFRIQAFCDIENTASGRVLEKIGMSKEGVLRQWVIHPNISARPRDCLMYAKTKQLNQACERTGSSAGEFCCFFLIRALHLHPERGSQEPVAPLDRYA